MVEYSSDKSQHGSDGVRTNEEERSIGQGGVNHSLDWMDTLRSLRDEVRSFKANNDRLVRDQEWQTEINVVILQSLSDW